MTKDYGSWSLANLKAELRKRNAKVTGRKAVLAQRLLEYDIMFGGLVNDPEATYHITVPGPEHFFDINSNTILASITEQDIKNYSVLGERENLSTSRNMYDENYLISSRVAQSGNNFYVTAVCAAEMRKNVVYNITLKMQENIILEAQCECAAGMGPYGQCKHVLVLMYGLEDFTKNKKINTRTSPTSILQTFHHPAHVYTGQPVKAENLKLKLNNSNLNKITTFDPLSNMQTNEKYTENFTNLVINFATSQKSSMPIQQLRPPANKIALYKDHDYMEKTIEETYIESLTLTEEQRSNLEKSTRCNKKIWKGERKMRLQSSNFGKICKSSTNQKKLAKLFLNEPEILTSATKHGIKFETKALKKMTEVTKQQIGKCGIFVQEENQFLASTPDGIFGEHGVVEVKCPYSARDVKISPETISFLDLCHETGYFKLDETHNYFYQVQGQMLCTGRKLCYFGIYTYADFYHVEIHRNDNFISEMLRKLILFYNDHYKPLFLLKYL